MDNNESEPMFFAPNTHVIVVSQDETEMGQVIHHDEMGIILRTTHRVEIVHTEATEEQRAMVENIFDEMSVPDLKRYAVENGLNAIKALIWKTPRLKNACKRYALSKMESEGKSLMPLMHPVKQWISYTSTERVIDAADYLQNNTLVGLDFDPTEDYSETKTEPKTTEGS